MTKLNRRDLINLGAVGLAASTLAAPAIAKNRSRPTVISSGNGNRYTNGGDETCVARAFRLMTDEGADVLDALIAGVNIVELDPEDSSVGYGGLPDANGVVTLDSCCMHGPKKRAGGVAALQGVRMPSLVAQKVADHTDHHLLVGQGAQVFARQMGFEIEDDLNTDYSRGRWLEWKQRTDARHYLDPMRKAEWGMEVTRQMAAEGLVDPDHIYGTINCNGVNAAGEVCGVTTTSGLAWKIPGRAGDSPILGAGLYVDGEVGAAGSTGRGEANLYSLASYVIVDEMRRGKAPKDAGMAALQRIHENTTARLLNKDGQPSFNVNFYVLARSGEHAGVTFYASERSTYAMCDENGPASLPIEPMFAR